MDTDDILKKQLDAMLAEAPQPAAVAGKEVPAVEAAPAPVDPLAHLIGQANPDADRDPFSMMLDGMLAEEGLSKDTEIAERKTEGFEQHEWEFKSEVKYEDDLVEVICKKCFRQMRMDRHQTTSEAMQAHQVNPDCGMGITSEVMDS